MDRRQCNHQEQGNNAQKTSACGNKATWCNTSKDRHNIDTKDHDTRNNSWDAQK